MSTRQLPTDRVEKLLEASTGNITEADAKLLSRFAEPNNEGLAFPGVVVEYVDGYFVTIPRFSGLGEYNQRLQATEASPAMIELLTTAYREHVRVLWLDCGADLLAGFESFEW